MEIIRKFTDKKPSLVLIQGSPRRKDSCANQTSKSQKVVEHIISKWGALVDIELIDLSVNEKPTISPCKGCVSTAGGFHCHWPCSCFKKGLKTPDLLYEKDAYEKLERCDGFIVISPIHWYSVSTNVKAMFDRLVCSNLTLTTGQAEKMFGKGNIKNQEFTSREEIKAKNTHLLKNHLKGKVGGFYIHGDDGANDYSDRPVPYVGDKEDNWQPKDAIMPIVYQMRYSEVICPDNLIMAFYVNEGKPYSKADDDFNQTPEFISYADLLVSGWVEEVEKNKKVLL
jgi:multimeric flavodoxin WrbA